MGYVSGCLMRPSSDTSRRYLTLNLCYSRLLLVTAVDGRLPARFARLNRDRVPVYALLFQVGMVAMFAAMLYFLVPSFTGLGPSASDLNSMAYNVIGASLTLIWALSYMAPFASVIILFVRGRQAMRVHWFLSLPVLIYCVFSGMLTLLISIITTLLNSFIPALLPNTSWWYIIGLTMLVCLGFCLLASMYGSSQARYEQMQG
jgi:amino acid permease